MASLLAVSCAGPPPPLPPGRVPIVFVHGYGTSSAVFGDMIDHLEAVGYPPGYLLAVDLVPADGANIAAAQNVIAPAVDELLARTGSGPDGRVDVVAHSMGALSARWYTTRVRPERVRTLVTVGGANHGTDALCGYPTDGGRDLCPSFDPAADGVQAQLNGTPDAPRDETPYGRGRDTNGAPTVAADADRDIRYVCVVIPGDRWILPVTSSELDGADPVELPADVAVEEIRPGNVVFSEPAYHDAVLGEDRLFVLLDAVLAAPDRADGR